MKKFIKQNWFKIIFVICVIFVTAGYLWNIKIKIQNNIFNKDIQCKKENSIYFYNSTSNKCEKPEFKRRRREIANCSFELKDVREYKGTYSENSNSYIVYEGLIKNNSEKSELLKTMTVKVYNEKNIFIAEGHTSIKEFIEPGKSFPFKVHVLVPTAHNTVIRKYFNESSSFNPDIYPSFLTCE